MTDSLQMETLRAGSGAEAKQGDNVTVHYVGTLTNGSKFDSSRDRGKGFSFTLGAGRVIKGWEQGVTGMKVGELRKLTIPPHLAYGDRGFPGAIPPNSTLVFEVELLSVGWSMPGGRFALALVALTSLVGCSSDSTPGGADAAVAETSADAKKLPTCVGEGGYQCQPKGCLSGFAEVGGYDCGGSGGSCCAKAVPPLDAGSDG
jgi:hypothetical protein